MKGNIEADKEASRLSIKTPIRDVIKIIKTESSKNGKIYTNERE